MYDGSLIDADLVWHTAGHLSGVQDLLRFCVWRLWGMASVSHTLPRRTEGWSMSGEKRVTVCITGASLHGHHQGSWIAARVVTELKIDICIFVL
jgi:hypothetical protein